MNPFKNVWKLLNERAKEKNPRNIEDLWTNSKGEWEKISVLIHLNVLTDVNKNSTTRML